MKPYYQDERVTLYHGDCSDVLPTLGENSVDLLLTDPPYGVQWQSASRKLQFDKISGDDSVETALIGVGLSIAPLKGSAHAYIFGRFDFSALPLSGHAELIWDKDHLGSGDLSSPWGPQHEYIQFYKCVKRLGVAGETSGRLSARLRRGSVIRCQRLNATQVARHPTEKPVRLLRQLIESSTCFDDIVLDPFAGSCSTLIAARLENRRAIGIELKEQYCERAAEWLSQGTLSEMFR